LSARTNERAQDDVRVRPAVTAGAALLAAVRRIGVNAHGGSR
jgi:hypothetical protein